MRTAAIGILIGLLVAVNPASAQQNEPRATSRAMNRNPVALQHDPDDPRYKAHPSGGNVKAFIQKFQAQAAAGQSWRIVSDCASACTTGFGAFAKDKICIGASVRLGFHEGASPASTSAMWNSYPAEIKSLINGRGGMHPEWLWIPAREFHALGYKRC